MSIGKRKHILVVSDDFVDVSMGGVGVRNWELSHALASHCKVTLAIPNESKLTSDTVMIRRYNREAKDLLSIAQSADVILIQGFVLHFQPYLAQLKKPLAVDLYVPSLLESLVWHDRSDWNTWIPEYEEYIRVQHVLLRQGDFFFCASERQREYWLGWLHSEKRINPHTFRQDPTLRSLIDVVPFGIPASPPASVPAVLKGVHRDIKSTDKVLLWSGGLWDWLDPLTLIRAVAEMVPQHPEIKLYFLGTEHPNPVVRGMRMAGQARELSQQLGLLDHHIFFGDWTPYKDRGRYLSEADLAVVTYPDHIETHFSFRTRVLDCIWAGLPVISTQGDTLSEWIATHGIGRVVPPNDVSALSAAILGLLESKGSPAMDQAFRNLRGLLQWDLVAQPLIQFCLKPYLAPDKGMYLTESEKIARDKDEFLAQVIRDKDAFLAQVIRDKDAHLERVIMEREARLKRVVRGREMDVEKARKDEKRRFIHKITEKDATIAHQQQQIEKYQRSFPMRVYSALKRFIKR